jgi:glycosyltransferase involved in cell wall biosynthesis
MLKRAIIITSSFPEDNKSGEIILKKLCTLLSNCFNEVIVIISGKTTKIEGLPKSIYIKSTGVEERKSNKIYNKIYKHIKSQLIMCKLMAEFELKNTPIFFWNAGFIIIPNIYATLKKAKTVYFNLGNISVSIKKKFKGITGHILGILSDLIQFMNFHLSNYIAIENFSMINTDSRIKKYNYKIVEISLFVDINKFKKQTEIYNRNIDIAYIGRFSKEKGILEFLEMLELMNIRGTRYKTLIVGDGIMKSYVKDVINKLDFVSLYDWLSYDEMPKLLNNIKVIILPSYTEGLPNILIEAMSCGAVPIATGVGGIPGVITVGHNGWLINDNKPATILDYLEEALKDGNLDNISNRATEFVKKYYSFDGAVERLKKALNKMDITVSNNY